MKEEGARERILERLEQQKGKGILVLGCFGKEVGTGYERVRVWVEGGGAPIVNTDDDCTRSRADMSHSRVLRIQVSQYPSSSMEV